VKFTLGWLKEHLDTTASLEEIRDGLIGAGLEVEGISDPAEALKPFTVARVIEARPHPNADRLKVLDVETARGRVQVVCGAANARTGLIGLFAPPGTHIPGTGLDLEPGLIRGVESNGMMCSERELQLSDDHEGIIDLETELPVGTPAAVALGLDDPVFHIKVTPNRPDALGVRGIARDLAAKGLGTLKPLDVRPVQGSFISPVAVRLAFDGDTSPCPLFVGRYFRGVRNGPSPDWLARRLMAIGLRPISALVDITNYITYAFSRPLHVFDADRIRGNIQVRLARPGETIAALDGRTYELDPAVTVIADDEGAESIGGIMGGERSGCTDDTVNVFLEAALFDPVRTAASGRKLAIQSDARYRFERGVDPAFVIPGAEIATGMILDICGGSASELVIAGAVPAQDRRVTLRPSRVKTLGGLDVPQTRQVEILTALGFTVRETEEGLECQVPSFRPDIRGEADLVEEVCRIIGLDKVPATPMRRLHAVARPVLTPLQRRIVAVRRRLASLGLNEAVTWSFLAESQARLFGGGQPELKLDNPISSELSDMRPSLLPNLIAATGRNMARGFADIGLFEVGQAYGGDRPEQETVRAAAVRRGAAAARHWASEARAIDVFDVKADSLAALAAAGAPVGNVQTVAGGPSWFHPGRSGTLQLGPKLQLGWFGEIHPRVLQEMDVRGPLYGFEIILDAVPEPRGRSALRPALEASDLMPIKRDFAFVVDDSVEAEKLVKAVRGADKVLISDVVVFDVFAGGAIGAGKKSVAIEITISPRERSLTEQEIEAISAKVVAQASKATGATLRS
jgi:phenylalanyl-tRNA synthetase beta chain